MVFAQPLHYRQPRRLLLLFLATSLLLLTLVYAVSKAYCQRPCAGSGRGPSVGPRVPSLHLQLKGPLSGPWPLCYMRPTGNTSC